MLLKRQSALITGLLAVLALLALVGCSSDDDDANEAAAVDAAKASDSTGSTMTEATETEAEPVSEDALAQSILLTIDDFPAGWSEDTTEDDDEDEESPFDKCELDKENDPAGEAESGDFSQDDFPTISHQVAVYENAKELDAALDKVPELVDCMADVANDGGLDDEDVEATDVRAGPVSFSDVGDRTEAYRLTFELSPRSGEGAVSVHIDIVYVTVDRVGMAILGVNAFSPTDTTLLQDLASTAVGKAQSALAQ